MEPSYTLEGIVITENPMISQVKHELKYLSDKRSDFVALRKGYEFVQCIPHGKQRNYFIVEIKLSKAPGGILYRHEKPLSLTKTHEIFKEFLKQGSVRIDDKWHEVETEFDVIKGSKKSAIVIVTLLALIILAGTSFAAHASNMPWYQGFVTGLLAVSYIALMGFLLPPYYKKIVRQVIRKSIDMDMPCEVNPRGRIRVLDKKKKESKKLAKLEAFYLGKVMVFIFILLMVLMAFIGIAALLQEYTGLMG